MDKETSYVYPLEEDVILRVKFTTKRGKLQRYMVQLEYLGMDNPQIIARADNTHKFQHIDVYNVKGKVTKIRLPMTEKEALSYAIKDFQENYRDYIRRYFMRKTK